MNMINKAEKTIKRERVCVSVSMNRYYYNCTLLEIDTFYSCIVLSKTLNFSTISKYSIYTLFKE